MADSDEPRPDDGQGSARRVTILRSWLYVPRRVTSLKRILHEGSFIAASLLRAMRQRKPDVLFVTSPPLGLSVAAIVLGRLWRVPYVFHVADLQPDTAVDLGMLKRGKLVRALYRLERIAYRDAALVSTLTPAMRQRIVSKGIVPEKVVLFRDWTDPPLFDIPLQGGGEEFRDSLGLRDRLMVVHAGNMGVKQGLDIVLEAAQRSRAMEDIIYLLVGDGATRPALEARAAALNLSNLKFLPVQRREAFHELLAATDIALITQQRVVADIVFPPKTMTLLAAGRPIVASLKQSSEVARADRVTPEIPDACSKRLWRCATILPREPAARKTEGSMQAACGTVSAYCRKSRDICSALSKTDACHATHPGPGRTISHNPTNKLPARQLNNS